MKSNTTVLVITGILIAGGTYWYFFTGTGNEQPLTISTSENPAQVRFKELINRMPESFDTNIFSDARFNSLIDLTTQITPESAGRLDPFAPIQGVSNK